MKEPKLPAEVRDLMAGLWADIQRGANDREMKAAVADPLAHKLSKVFPGGIRYRYYPGGLDGRGRAVRFCWSTVRNVAGFYLGWREVIGKTGGRRDSWASRRVKARLVELAERRAATFGRDMERWRAGKLTADA